MRTRAIVACTALLAVAGGCRGQSSDEPPIHLNPNMDDQAYYQAQEPSTLFANNMAMRPEVPGTVAVGELREDDHLYRGMIAGAVATTLPMPLTSALLERGRQRFDIYCSACHDRTGTGEGIVVARGMVPPPSFHDARIRAMPVGEFFQVMSEGRRNMPALNAQIPVEDRWAIAAYVRALQLSRAASSVQVPSDILQSKGWQR